MPEHRDELEAIVDAIGLGMTLSVLAMIAGDKADHLRSNWQDAGTAKVWEAAGRDIGKLAAKIDI